MYIFKLVKFWLDDTSFFIMYKQHTYESRKAYKKFTIVIFSRIFKIPGQNT